MTRDREIIAVLGATGAQGGGLVRAVLDDPQGLFAVRAITRDDRSEGATALARLGAEVVAASLDDESSLRRAFEGAHAAYCVTFFWDHLSPDREQAQARNLAEAASAARLQHVVWSTLEDTRRWVPLSDDRMPTLGGRWKVPHFDGKGASDHFFTDLGVPTTFLLTSFYWDNFLHFERPKRRPDGTFAIAFPMGGRKLPGIATEDIGRCAYGIFKRGRDLVGETVGIAGEHLTGAQLAAALTRALGRKVAYEDVPPDVYRRLGFPGAEDLGNMFQFKRDFNDAFVGARSVERSRELNPGLQSFDRWLAANGARIQLE